MTKLYENHRPTTKDEIIGQESAVDEFFALLDNKLVTDFLFIGQSGVGKTTTAKIAARYLWGDNWEERYHEFNASDDRGIGFVRNEIKELAAFSYPKIILLDEADNMTTDAYEAMRKIVEGSKNTIFILCANNDGAVLQAIKSRCKVIKFMPLSDEHIWIVITNILDKEEISYDLEEVKVQEMLENIAILCDGDLRIAIQELAPYIHIEDGKKTLRLDRPIEGKPNITYLVKGLELALNGNLNDAIKRVEDALIVDRIIPKRAANACYEYAKKLTNDTLKAEIICALGRMDVSLKSSYPLIQYVRFLSYVWLVGSKSQ